MWIRTEICSLENAPLVYEFKQADAEGAMLAASSSVTHPILFHYISINRELDENQTVSNISVGYEQSDRFKSCVEASDITNFDAPECHPDFIDEDEYVALNRLCKLLDLTESSIDWDRGIIKLDRPSPDNALILLRYVYERAPVMDPEMCHQLYLDSGTKRPPGLIHSEIQSIARESIKSAVAQAISYQNDGYTDAVYYLAEYLATTGNATAALETYMMVPGSSKDYREAQLRCCNIMLEKLASENPDEELKHKYEQQLLGFALNCGNGQLATSLFAKLSGKPADEPETPIALDANTIVSLSLEISALRRETPKKQPGKRLQRSIFSSFPASSADAHHSSPVLT